MRGEKHIDGEVMFRYLDTAALISALIFTPATARLSTNPAISFPETGKEIQLDTVRSLSTNAC